MYVKDVVVKNSVGLHARPATFFIQKANEFKSSIWVEKDERRVNAKSLLGVLSLGIIGGTGSSKSTFVQMIPRLYDVTEGSVSVGGIDVRNYDLETLRDELEPVAIGWLLDPTTPFEAHTPHDFGDLRI